MVCMQNRDSSQGIFWTLWRLRRPHTLQCSKLEKREEKSSDDNDQVHFVCEENKFLSHNRITGSQSRVQNMVFCILGANLSSSEHSYLGRGAAVWNHGTLINSSLCNQVLEKSQNNSDQLANLQPNEVVKEIERRLKTQLKVLCTT